MIMSEMCIQYDSFKVCIYSLLGLLVMHYLKYCGFIYFRGLWKICIFVDIQFRGFGKVSLPISLVTFIFVAPLYQRNQQKLESNEY